MLYYMTTSYLRVTYNDGSPPVEFRLTPQGEIHQRQATFTGDSFPFGEAQWEDLSRNQLLAYLREGGPFAAWLRHANRPSPSNQTQEF